MISLAAVTSEEKGYSNDINYHIILDEENANIKFPGQNGRQFADDNFKCIFLYESMGILYTNITATLVYKGPVDLNHYCFMY